jgi:hypothetical protein
MWQSQQLKTNLQTLVEEKVITILENKQQLSKDVSQFILKTSS